MQPELDPVMSEIKAYGLETFVPIVSDEVGLFLKLITGLQKPKHILEIGCGISYSTHWFLKANSPRNDVRDLFPSSFSFNSFLYFSSREEK